MFLTRSEVIKYYIFYYNFGMDASHISTTIYKIMLSYKNNYINCYIINRFLNILYYCYYIKLF